MALLMTSGFLYVDMHLWGPREFTCVLHQHFSENHESLQTYEAILDIRLLFGPSVCAGSLGAWGR
eukprot:scaffold64737_cov17-Tisochrysis_lutea.AAC.1